MLTGLRGLAQSFVRGAVRIGMTVTETYWSLKEMALGYLEPEVRIDYEKYARQDYIHGVVKSQDQDQLIAGDLHETSIWNLSEKYRYEVDTPYLTKEGKSFVKTTTITSPQRLTPNEILDKSEAHIDQYEPEDGVLDGPQEISSVWVT